MRPQAKIQYLDIHDICAFDADDFRIIGYEHHPAIKAQVAI